MMLAAAGSTGRLVPLHSAAKLSDFLESGKLCMQENNSSN